MKKRYRENTLNTDAEKKTEKNKGRTGKERKG